jgi:hypothetical protein
MPFYSRHLKQLPQGTMNHSLAEYLDYQIYDNPQRRTATYIWRSVRTIPYGRVALWNAI